MREKGGALLLEKFHLELWSLPWTNRESHSPAIVLQHFQAWMTDGVRDVTFLVGGSDGLSPETLTRAHLRLSMGKQTWPHLLARCMLLEQIYRAQCILGNHPYHK